jgi:hypothetical protein
MGEEDGEDGEDGEEKKKRREREEKRREDLWRRRHAALPLRTFEWNTVTTPIPY